MGGKSTAAMTFPIPLQQCRAMVNASFPFVVNPRLIDL
jgi:hypothetical protein